MRGSDAKFRPEDLSFHPDGTVTYLGRRGDLVTLFATENADRYGYKNLPEIDIYRCTLCTDWSREALQLGEKYICSECAEDVARKFLLSREMSDQFFVPQPPPLRPAIHATVRAAVFARGQQRCAYCGDSEPTVLEHVVPVSQRGAHTPENLVPSCGPCNQKKGGRTPEQAGMPLQPWAGITHGATL